MIMCCSLCFAGFGDRCYVKDKSFYVCREGFGDRSQCDGVMYKANKKKHHSYIYGHGSSAQLDGKKYYCCRSGDRSGWVEAGSNPFYTATYIDPTITETTLTDGTVKRCQITRRYTACNNLPTVKDDGTSDDWKKPDYTYQDCHECAAATPYFRNGECVALCGQTDYTMAFESINSNNCIKCETTKTQGIISVDDKGTKNDNEEFKPGLFNVCMKCNPATQFFDSKKGCVEKSSFLQSNKMQFKECWMAENSAMFKCCITLNNGKALLDNYLKSESEQNKNQVKEFEKCLGIGEDEEDEEE